MVRFLYDSLPKVKDDVFWVHFGGKVGDEPRNCIHFSADELLFHINWKLRLMILQKQLQQAKTDLKSIKIWINKEIRLKSVNKPRHLWVCPIYPIFNIRFLIKKCLVKKWCQNSIKSLFVPNFSLLTIIPQYLLKMQAKLPISYRRSHRIIFDHGFVRLIQSNR